LSQFAGKRYGEEYPLFKSHMIELLAHEKTHNKEQSSSSSGYDSGNEDFADFVIDN